MGHRQGLVAQFFKILNPFCKFETGETRNVKFSLLIDLGMSQNTPSRVWSVSRIGTEFLNFKTPYLNLERMMLETLNSVHG